MYGERGFRQKTAPVRVGDEMDVTIEAVGEKGDGVAKKEGFVLFVPGTKKGDQVKIKVTKVLRSVGFAEVVGKKGTQSEDSSEESEELSEESEEGEKEETEGEESSDSEEDSEDFGEEEE